MSAVVPAYNEERNIVHMLDSLLAQHSALGDLVEVVVVASGCTDGTARCVDAAQQRDGRVRLLTQSARQGKVSAVNAYLLERDASADILVVASADVLFAPGVLDAFLLAFDTDPRVGMCGGRPIPSNGAGTVMGRIDALLWELHHQVALIAPKLGEAVAVRAPLLPRLPVESILDEATIEAMVTGAGFTLRYVPEAVVVNRGPETVREFLDQRRRNAAGHYLLRAQTGYRVSTLAVSRLAGVMLRHLRAADVLAIATCSAAVLLETVARALGHLDVLRGRDHAVWKIAASAHSALSPISAPVSDRGRH